MEKLNRKDYILDTTKIKSLADVIYILDALEVVFTIDTDNTTEEYLNLMEKGLVKLKEDEDPFK